MYIKLHPPITKLLLDPLCQNVHSAAGLSFCRHLVTGCTSPYILPWCLISDFNKENVLTYTSHAKANTRKILLYSFIHLFIQQTLSAY